MRILFLAPGDGADYQCDMLLHGLRSLLGSAVVDVPRRQPLYERDPRKRALLHGKGFTLYGLLKDEEIDRDDIPVKIATHYFDIVIYGSIHRCRDYLSLVLESYQPGEIIFIDGEDYAEAFYWPVRHRGLYFKRENDGRHPGALPLQFAIPACRILDTPPRKERVMAFIDPRDRSTYVYDTEEAYYGDYAASRFGVTLRKGGWDCLRHYEILANHCAPLFLDLEQCPALTMVHFPRYEVVRLAQVLESRGVDYFATPQGENLWDLLTQAMVAFLRRHLTTEALARDLLERWRRETR